MKKELKIATIIIVILAEFCSIAVLYAAINSNLNILYKMEAIVDLLALVIACVYLINGYKKSFSNYYKNALIVDAIHALLVTATASNEQTKYISIISCAICFGLIMVLAFAKDLGKKTSIIFCILVIILRTSGLIATIINSDSILDTQIILVLSQLVLALTILVATIGKYIDKQKRGKS